MAELSKTGLGLLVVGALGASACGYSEDEWQAQLAKYGQLQQQHTNLEASKAAQQKELEAKIAAVTLEIDNERKRAALLEEDLLKAGVDLDKLSGRLKSTEVDMTKLASVLEEREKALAEYKQRAAQLERIKARFALLRKKLTELTNIGLKVKIRNNRMVISLPGDVLFGSGQDKLKDEGKEILDQVARIINGDQSLKKRVFQVAGHTDNVAFRGGVFQDNWGLSLMRARRVLVYLVDPDTGGLPRTKWSAAGFAETDPIGTNDSPAGRQSNRRCELILVPSAEEMLDLKDIAK
ncbi:MAG: OmpA family protein [Deltaproteobacteria bacterium]|nr:OmpA family protein [Deltaproteobacteria bacterium]